MSYIVLARRWRPQRFGDIVGQGHVTRIITNAIRSGKTAHSYLFTGVRGVGKTTAARILAKALNCEQGPAPEPCNECSHCKEIVSGSSIDVFEIDGATNRGIEDVRQIIENVRYQPAECRFKIYIIDEVHQITKDAFNALLKTLEEPPPFVKFILATTEPHRLPETILSRCQQFDFRRISVRDIAQRLKQVADVEKLRLTEGALLLIAREGDGSMRDAQTLLEQVLSYSAPESGEWSDVPEVDEHHLHDILGITERKTLYELSEAVIQGRASRCIELLSDVVLHGLDLSRLSRDLVEHFRNLLVVKLLSDLKNPSQGSQVQSPESWSLLDVSDHEVEELKEQVSNVSVSVLMDYFRHMANGDEEITRSSYPKFALEATLVRLSTLPMSIPVIDAIARLESLERKLLDGSEKAESLVQKNDSKVYENNVDTVSSISPTLDDKEQVWKDFCDFVKKENKMLASYLEQVYLVELKQGMMEIGVGNKHHLSILQDAENLSNLETYAYRYFSNKVALTITSLSPGLSVDKKGSGNMGKSVYREENDKVKAALGIFGGTIRNIKRNTES